MKCNKYTICLLYAKEGDGMKFLDLFSGIGGFRLGMEMAGHECVGHCEIDKYAEKTYRAMHNPKEGEWYATDITKVRANEIPGADIWCFGFPCQDISVAGKQKGLDGERSGLFYKVIDLIKGKKEEDRPSILFIENVKNLLSVNDGWDFAKILFELDEAGFDAEWQIINSSWFVPQNRERIFIIGHLRGRSTRKVFPITGSNRQTLKQVIGGSDAQRVYDVNGLARTLKAEGGGQGAKTGLYLVNSTKEGNCYCIDSNYGKGTNNLNKGRRTPVAVRPVLTPERFNKRQNGRRFKEPGEPMFTLTAQDRHGVEIHGRIRRLTPRECFRLQGFPDEYFERARAVNSDTQLYKQAGNSVTVPVIYEIAKRL